jgi:hypothetical protein
MSIQQLEQTVRELVTASKLKEALDMLLTFLKSFGNDDLHNNTILLSSQFNRVKEDFTAKGIIDYTDDYSVELNRITKGILETILPELNKPLPNKPDASTFGKEVLYKEGKLMHNISSEMTLGVKSRCTIRIAPDELKLMRDFEKTDSTHIQNIALAEVMAVTLRCDEDDAFAIEALDEATQKINFDDYTQWLYFITPLMEGFHSVLLKISVVEMINGKEVTRQVVLEKKIEIGSLEATISEAPFVYKTSGWQTGDFKVNYSYVKEPAYEAPKSSMKRMSSVLMLLLFFIGSAVAGISLFVGWDKVKDWLFGKSTPIVPIVKTVERHPVFLVFKSSKIGANPSVFLNDALIVQDSIIKIATDTCQISVPLLNRRYDLRVEGEKGTCRSKEFVMTENSIIVLDCDGKDTGESPSELPPIPSTPTTPNTNTWTVNLLHQSPDFNDAQVLIDGKVANILSRANGYVSVSVSKGTHTFTLNNGRYSCQTQSNIQAAANINFPICSWTVLLNVSSRFKKPNVMLNGKSINYVVKWSEIPASKNLHIILPPQTNSFNVVVEENKLRCAEDVQINRNLQQIDMACSGISHRVKIKLKSDAFYQLGNGAYIRIDDGEPFQVKPDTNFIKFSVPENRFKTRKIEILTSGVLTEKMPVETERDRIRGNPQRLDQFYILMEYKTKVLNDIELEYEYLQSEKRQLLKNKGIE